MYNNRHVKDMKKIEVKEQQKIGHCLVILMNFVTQTNKAHAIAKLRIFDRELLMNFRLNDTCAKLYH